MDLIFKSAGDHEELYRIVLKKAILNNLESLKLLEQGKLVAPAQNALIDMVMEKMDGVKSGVVT